MEPTQCANMMLELASAGFGGAYLHARLGMLIPYMSEAYQDAIAASVLAADKSGICAHLYDEDRWPSGWAGGAVPLADKAFRIKALIQLPNGESAPEGARSIASDDKFKYAVVTMPLGHPKFNGTCYTDLTNPQAVSQFIASAYEPLNSRLGADFGQRTPAIFTDEPALTYLYTWPKSGLPWSDRLPVRFKAAMGIDVTDVLANLFQDLQDYAAVRVHYYRTLAELFADSFMKQIADWCRRHDIAWTGHFMYEHSLPLHFSWSANCHASYRYFDWPGVDHLGRQIGEVVTAIGCRSAVHQFSKPRMMSELFGASGQNLSFADRKWIAEQQLVLGVNHLVPHLTSTTIRGPRKRDYPPTISPHQPWWPLNTVIEEHLSRLCRILSHGDGEPDLLVVHPQESVFALSRGPVPLGEATTWVDRFFHPATDNHLQQTDEQWKELSHRLLDAGYVFDFGDEGVLEDCGRVADAASGPTLQVGAANYDAVLMPTMFTIRPSTIKLLEEFAAAGGPVFLLGDLPTMVDGSSDQAATLLLGRLADSITQHSTTINQLVGCLRKSAPAAIQIDSIDGHEGRVWRYTKRRNDGRVTLIANLDRMYSRQIALTWQTPPAEVRIWPTHCRTSRCLAPSAGRLSLELPPGTSHLLFEGKWPETTPPLMKPAAIKYLEAQSLSWTANRLDPNTLVVDEAEFHTGDFQWRGPFPVLAIKEWLDEKRHIGPVVLRYSFATAFSPFAKPSLQLVIESIERPETSVRINGRHIDISSAFQRSWIDPHFHPIDVPPEIIAGHMRVEFEIQSFEFGDTAAADPARRLGTELESLIVLGDFSVEAHRVDGAQGWHGQIEYHTATPLSSWLPPQRIDYFVKPFTLLEPTPLKPGDATTQGLPFYAGRIRYETKLPRASLHDAALILRLDSLAAAIASVEVNGHTAGTFAWPPHELNISSHLTQPENTLAITFYSSLRNLLGPHHHPDGEPVYVHPGSFRPERCVSWLETLAAYGSVAGWSESYATIEFGLPASK